jgi:iron complex transport system ATP-binding protein
MSVIKLSKVTLVREGETLLNDVSWEVTSGQHWALIGKNGSGKTLTLRVVCGYLWPSTGSVEILDQRFGQCDIRELRKKIGWVTPALQFQLLQRNFIVKDIVLSGCYASIGLFERPNDEFLARAQDKMKFMGCDHLADREFSTLSTGEQKRVVLARALAAEPELLILDEPCTGLDLVSREDFLTSIEKLGTAAEKSSIAPTVIYVTHHVEEIMPFISHCMLMKDRGVYSAGEKGEVLSSSHLSNVLGASIKVEPKNGRTFVNVSL